MFNFRETPPADGAWIVKNSWGTDWGDNGLFYLSYFDATVNVFGSFTMEDYGEIDNIYQYDGNTGLIFPYFPNYGILGANIFTADSDETLKAVGFWTTEAETPYNIKIYTDIPEGGTPSSGTLVHSQSGSEAYAGYHKIDLTADIDLDSGCRYAVVVDLMKVDVVMTMDTHASGTGVSFYSPYTGSYSWRDAGSVRNVNVCIKAFTSERNVTGVHIDETTFPDSTFRTLISAYDTDNNEYLSDSEIASIEILDVSNQGITKLDGIEYLTSLTGLNCKGNSLIRLDLTKNTKLQQLNCAFNQLTTLDVSGNPELNLIYCIDNKLTKLDLSNNPKLADLFCSTNQIEELDVSNLTELKTLYCSSNKLTQLDLSENPKLETVECYLNQLSSLDVSNCSNLQTLQCFNNQLSSIDLSGKTKLTELKCADNQLSSLDLSDCTALKTLSCTTNVLESLDLTKNVNIDYVECSENKLTELLIPDVETIGTLYCNKNNLVCFNLNNTEVTSFSMDDNVRNIGAVKSDFDMSGFKGFDPSKVSRWSGAEYDAEKNVFTDFTALTVTYSYYCGQTKYVTVTLQADSVEDMYMTIDECIDYVNAIDLSDTCTELSDKQLKAIERVLEYDYSK